MISHMTVKWSGLSVCVPITELIPFINIKNLLIAKCYWEEKEEGKVPSRANAGKNKLCVALLDSEDLKPRSALTGNFQYQLFSCLTSSQKQNNYKKCITDKKRGGGVSVSVSVCVCFLDGEGSRVSVTVLVK